MPMTIISYLNSLDHNLITLPFVASEDAETMDEVFRGSEEQLERTNAVVEPCTVLELIDVLFFSLRKEVVS